MSANYLRRFLFDPGVETLLEIESVNILDLEPPAALTGVGTGTVLTVGEFENGPFEQREITSSTDFRNTLGTFGYEYDGVPANNPSARSRKADGALSPEFWNGNGFISLANKKFARLIVLRIDTSIGEVQFTRLACLSGSTAVEFTLNTGETLDFDPGSGPVAATFTGVVALTTSGAGTYPTTFVGGEKFNVTIDDGTIDQIGPIDIIFQASDQLQADVVNRINAVLGYTAAVDAGGGLTDLSGRVEGTTGEVLINSIDAAVITATGFVAGSDAGTGNVASLKIVTVAEVNTLVNAASSDVTADRDANGALRLCNNVGTTLEITAPTTALGLGFVTGDAADSAVGTAGTIPAGTRVRNGSAVEWVTMQDIAVTEASAGPYSVKVRPALDDGTVLGSAAGSVTVLPFPIDLGGFAVTNPAPLDAAKTEAQLDALYFDAIATTKSISKVGKETNVILSARMSNIIRSQLRTNAIEASGEGAFGRVAIIRPPLSTTTRSQATSTTTQPGVGAYRNQRVLYAYPGVQTFVSQIAARGTAGGAGFTVDGIIDVAFDAFVGSVLSQLPPEENPGQVTDFLSGVLGLEAGNSDVQDLNINDYKLFKKSGIMAPRIADGVAIIQSGVTSVDPLVNPSLKNVNRRRMADFVQDTLGIRMTAFGKRLSTISRRAAMLSEVRTFLQGLVDDERLDSFSVVVGSDRVEIQKGIFRMIIKVVTLASLESIVLESTIGEQVIIDEAA